VRQRPSRGVLAVATLALDHLIGRWTLDTSPAYVAFDLMTRMLSPSDLNPLGFNPLRAVLAESIDFDRLKQAPIKLFVTATSVRTGRGRILRNAEITPDVVLASACLPTMFQAIEIDGELYWDGGFAGAACALLGMTARTIKAR
jgi:NTE family protein